MPPPMVRFSLSRSVWRPSRGRDDASRVLPKLGHGLVHLAGEDVAEAAKGLLLAAHGLVLAAHKLDELARVDVRVPALFDVLHELRRDVGERLVRRGGRRRRVHGLQRGLEGAQLRRQHVARGPLGAAAGHRGRGRGRGVRGVVGAGPSVGFVGRDLDEDLVERLDRLFELDYLQKQGFLLVSNCMLST